MEMKMKRNNLSFFCSTKIKLNTCGSKNIGLRFEKKKKQNFVPNKKILCPEKGNKYPSARKLLVRLGSERRR